MKQLSTKPDFKRNRVTTLSDRQFYYYLESCYLMGKNDATKKDFDEYAQEVLNADDA